MIGGLLAYSVHAHLLITRVALQGIGLEVPAEPIDPALPASIRRGIDATARSGPEAAEWARRYPEPERFDAWAEKELLLLSPEEQVFGIDVVELPRSDAAITLLEVAAQGSRQPDDDFRNRDRFAYDADRQRVLDANGQPVPADPALLNFGKIGALSSQAHAHYGLPDLEFSEDPAVLQEEPRRFAVASGYPNGPILTLAPEMAQLHADLAILAALQSPPPPPEGAIVADRSLSPTDTTVSATYAGARSLELMHVGQGLHYVEDVSNPIHTLQVGLYDFFVDAFKSRLWIGIKTGGGYLGEMRSLASIGIDILTNHHTISEEYTAALAVPAWEGEGTPEAERLVAAIAEDDPEFSKALDEALAKLGPHPELGEFGVVITETLIEVSSHDGDDVYRTTRAISDPKWRKAGVIFDYENDDATKAVVPATAETQAAHDEFWALQEKAWRRGGTAVRRYVMLEQKAVAAAQADPAVAAKLKADVEARLVTRQLKMLADAEARRADYLANPPVSNTAPERSPAILGAEIAVLALLIGVPAAIVALVRRRRRASA